MAASIEAYYFNHYRQVSNIRRILVGNKIVDHSDVVGASPVGAAPTASSFSTWHLAPRDSAKTAPRQYENLFKCWDLVRLILETWRYVLFSFHVNQIIFSWDIANNEIQYLIVKIEIKVTTKIRIDGHIWGLVLNRCLFFLFHGKWAIFFKYHKFNIWPWKFKVKSYPR